MQPSWKQRIRRAWLLALTALGLASTQSHAQTVRGRLLDAQSGQPIDLGVLFLLNADGDTVALAATNPDGRFSVTAPTPGRFVLRASAFRYAEKDTEPFELGEENQSDVVVRIEPEPLELEDIVVSTDLPRPDHPLIRNGFVDRYRMGLGHFITPRDLERTVYHDTESLFQFVPGVRVFTSSSATAGGRAVQGPPTDRVLMRSASGSCAPTVFVDGVRARYRPGAGETLSDMVVFAAIQAVEIYPRPAQVPVEYGGPAGSDCGVIVFWTKR